jgi:hypothetical protein
MTALASGLTIAVAIASHAGPTPSPTATPDYCDFEPPGCYVDKKCQVGGSEPQDSCSAFAGEEVTYLYILDTFPYDVGLRVEDDKLGLIGFAGAGDTLTKTTTLTETTTNTASVTSTGICPCINSDVDDRVTVTVTPPSPCVAANPVTSIDTVAKGQSPTNNVKLSHSITGHIVDADSLDSTVHRIGICAGTLVTAVVMDSTGAPTNSGVESLTCNSSGCSGVIEATEKYRSISQDGKDTDSITFLPK